MQISYIGSPDKISLDSQSLQLSVQNIISKISKNVSVLDVPNQKTAKIILLILNWKQVKQNHIIKQLLQRLENYIHIDGVFDRLEKDEIEAYASTLTFHQKAFGEFRDKIGDDQIDKLLKLESGVSYEVSEISENVPVKVLNSLSSPKPIRYAKIITIFGDKMRNVFLAVEVKKKVTIIEGTGEEKLRSQEKVGEKRVHHIGPQQGFGACAKLLLIIVMVAGMAYLTYKFDYEDEGEQTLGKLLIEKYYKYFPKQVKEVKQRNKIESKTKSTNKKKGKELKQVGNKKDDKNSAKPAKTQSKQKSTSKGWLSSKKK